MSHDISRASGPKSFFWIQSPSSLGFSETLVAGSMRDLGELDKYTIVYIDRRIIDKQID